MSEASAVMRVWLEMKGQMEMKKREEERMKNES
jgi:hypothetical protein